MNFIIKLEVYPFQVMVSLGEKNKSLTKKLKKWKVKSVDLGKYDGIYTTFNNGYHLIRLKKVPKSSYQFGVLQHEILHCTIQIMREVGMELSNKSEEAYTYLHGYLTYKILNEIK